MASEKPSDAFREIVVDGVGDDIEAIRREWDSRTWYGKLRILPCVAVYPIAAAALAVFGTVLAVFFATMERVAAAEEALREWREQLEPEVYKDDAE